MVWAVAEVVDVGTDGHQLLLDVGVQRSNGRLVVVAAGDAGLIRHHEGELAAVVDKLDRVAGAFDPFKAGD